ncbi:hypothetical protein ACJJTC_018239 [Scirpophaga incertulas]
MKKYYSSNATSTEKSTPKEKSINIAENSSAACSSTSELDTQCIEVQSSIPQISSVSTSSVRDTIIIPEPATIPELVEPVPSNLPENNLQLENIDPSCETNTSIESYVDNPDESQLISLPAVSNETLLNSKTRRRRTFEAVIMDVQEEPVSKRKKIDMNLSAHESEYLLPGKFQLYKMIDTNLDDLSCSTVTRCSHVGWF